MFIRETVKTLKKNGTVYKYVQHRLVQSVRINNQPRQQTLLNLGTLSIPKEQHKCLANLIEAHLTGKRQGSLFAEGDAEVHRLAKHFADILLQKRLQQKTRQDAALAASSAPAQEPVYEEVDIHSTTTSHSRTIGTESIVLSQMRRLSLCSILGECGMSAQQQRYAAAQIAARMIHPASERETARWLRDDSACGELLGVDLSGISDQTLHRVTDVLCRHRAYIEKRLSAVTSDVFSLRNTLILYDLTNTYFESPKRGSHFIRYGRSKEKRNDCPQITLALVVDAQGFPKRSRIIEGGASEPASLRPILEQMADMESPDGDGGPKTVVIDAGIATEENCAMLRADPRFEYVAISRSSASRAGLEFDGPSHTIPMHRGTRLEVTMVRRGDEVFVLCKSPERLHKDEAIHAQRRRRFEAALTQLHQGLHKPRTRKKYAAVCERIGRLKERYKVGPYYDITVIPRNGNAVAVHWRYIPQRVPHGGEYLIRTSRSDLTDEEISRMHRSLTMVESAFRWLKSDLGLRPNYHQSTPRVVAHASLSVLAYFILAPVLNMMEWGGAFISSCGSSETHEPWQQPYGWRGLVRTMASQTRVTTSFNCKNGNKINIRTTLQPTDAQRAIYRRLKLSPYPLKRVISYASEIRSAQK